MISDNELPKKHQGHPPPMDTTGLLIPVESCGPAHRKIPMVIVEQVRLSHLKQEAAFIYGSVQASTWWPLFFWTRRPVLPRTSWKIPAPSNG